MSNFDFNKLGDVFTGVLTFIGAAVKVAGSAIEAAKADAARAAEILARATLSLRSAEIDFADVLKKNDAVVDAEVAARRTASEGGGS